MSAPPPLSKSEEFPLLDEQRFQRALRRSTLALTAALGVPILILLGLVLFLLRSADLVGHTDRMISKANRVEKLLVSMQTGFRGFRLANDEKFLEPYHAARAEFEPSWSALADLVAGESESRAAVQRARDTAAQWVEFVEAQIADVRLGQSAARDPKFLATGAPLFDAIMKPLDELIVEAERQRAEQEERLRAVSAVLLISMGVIAAVGVPLLGGWLRRFLRTINASYGASLSASQARAAELQVTLDSIGDAVIATDAKGTVTFLNPVAEALMGWSSAEARGRDLAEVFDIFNERTGERAENPIERVLRENIVVGLANHTVLRSRNGQQHAIEDSAAPIRDAEGEVKGVILVFHDVTEKHATERDLQASEHRLRFLNQLGEATRTLIDPDEIMNTMTRMLGEHLRASRCAYADVEADGETFTILKDYTNDCATTAGTYNLALFGARAMGDMHGGRTFVARDVDRELEADSASAATFNAIGIKAIVCCPLVKEESLRAMMAVHQTTPRAWTEPEIRLVEEVVERCWATIERARAEADARERGRLSELRADIAVQLDVSLPLARSLQACCEGLVKYLDASFARIWTLSPDEPVLRLQASAGLYTHLDGAHAQVLVGEYKIGRIAQNRKPHLTNDVAHDPNISSPEWARREGMVAFAGYPLLAEGRVVGVLGIFARHTFSDAVVDDLLPIADTLATHIERKRAEESLAAARKQTEEAALAVADSARRFQLLAEVVSLQVWTANVEGALDWANQECIAYFGADLERDILGDGWAQFVHEDDLPPAVQCWQRSLATGERYEVEFRLRNAAGAFRWFLVRAEAMRDAGGRVVKWFGTNTDVHELKLAQAAAERASRTKDSFLAALSHELRTPLTPVLMAAMALRGDERLPAEVREQLSMMERNITLEARLIDDLLDLTRISQGKLLLRPEPCDVHSLIGMAVEIVRDDAFAKKLVLERGFAARRSGIRADPARFQQVFWNLLRNAVKFTPGGGRISIRTWNEGEDRVLIEVADSGIGITSEALGLIFQPFEQGDLTGDHLFGGLGLGLSIARAIVDLHGGTLRGHSEGLGKGAVFVVDLPGATELATGDLIGSSAGLEAGTAAVDSANGGSALRLLLVEDHEDSRLVISRLLRAAGHDVIAAGTITEALTRAAERPFDFVISDLGLPDGTGNELMEQLRGRYGLRGIALSGYGMSEDMERSRQSGFVAHLTKPVDFGQLERVLLAL